MRLGITPSSARDSAIGRPVSSVTCCARRSAGQQLAVPHSSNKRRYWKQNRERVHKMRHAGVRTSSAEKYTDHFHASSRPRMIRNDFDAINALHQRKESTHLDVHQHSKCTHVCIRQQRTQAPDSRFARGHLRPMSDERKIDITNRALPVRQRFHNFS
jgi:hypothetical protein